MFLLVVQLFDVELAFSVSLTLLNLEAAISVMMLEEFTVCAA